MTLYAGQVLRVVQASGETSATYLTVQDADAVGSSADQSTIWNICGNVLARAPALDSVLLQGTILDGSGYSVQAVHFAWQGRDYYLMPTEYPPEAVATVTTATSLGSATAFHYLDRSMSVDDERLHSGQALIVQLNKKGQFTDLGIGQVVVSDDDGKIQSNAEDGRAPEVFLGPHHGTYAFDDVALVEVSYHGTLIDSTFQALRYSIASGHGSIVYYMPLDHTVASNDVLSILGETILPGGVNGRGYGEFGLTSNTVFEMAGGAANFMQGSILADNLIGLGGNDSLIGGLEADLLQGGNGDDVLQGGMQNDTQRGGSGDDLVQGGNDQDRLYGEGGNDQAIGNWGDDRLYGGAGNDRLNGGSDEDQVSGGTGNDSVTGFEGNDTLFDGSGSDQLNAGVGADLFVMVKDGTTDRILDFQDGVDLIDLGLSFANLTFTTLRPGEVQISGGTDILLIFDSAHHLTADSFTAVDFV